MIRPATLPDVPRLVALGRRFLAESAYAGRLADNPAQMQAITEQLITQADGTILVATQGGVVVGMIGMLCFPHHLSAERTAGEVFWYVDPDHRGSGVRLLKAAERWALEQGARKIQLIAPSAPVGHIYARLGYTPIEVAYQKEVA